MPVIRLSHFVQAPPERLFDLARSIDMHMATATATGERAVGGRLSGLVELGEEVTWSARHLGVRQRLTAMITKFDRPHSFRDSMVRGAFARFDHDHIFEPADGGTTMHDVFDYTPPLGLLGRLADWLVVEGHMRRFLEERGTILKRVAESEEWRHYLPEPTTSRAGPSGS